MAVPICCPRFSEPLVYFQECTSRTSSKTATQYRLPFFIYPRPENAGWRYSCSLIRAERAAANPEVARQRLGADVLPVAQPFGLGHCGNEVCSSFHLDAQRHGRGRSAGWRASCLPFARGMPAKRIASGRWLALLLLLFFIQNPYLFFRKTEHSLDKLLVELLYHNTCPPDLKAYILQLSEHLLLYTSPSPRDRTRYRMP